MFFGESTSKLTSNVKQIMEDRKISIRTMVEHTGLSNMTILNARRRISKCRMSTLEIIAEYLKCKVKDLFDEV